MINFIHFKRYIISFILMLFVLPTNAQTAINLEIGHTQHTMQATDGLSDCTRGTDNSNNKYKSELYDPIILKLYSSDGPYRQYNPRAEILEKRTETSKTFKNADGSFTALMTAGPMHYLENGVWKTSSNEVLENISLSGYFCSNLHNRYKTYYGNLNNGVYIKDLVKSYKIAGIKLYDENKNELKSIISIDPAATPHLINENMVTYNINTNVDYEIEQLTNKIKTQYSIATNIFNTYNVSHYIGFEEVLTFDEPVTIAENMDKINGVVFQQNGESILSYSDLFYYSKNRTSSSIQEKAEYKVVKLDNRSYKIITLIPVAWLQNPNTIYPVVIDPTITYTPNTSSATFWTGTTNEDADAHSSDNIKVGFYDCPGCDDETWAPWAKINTSSIPDNACISNSSFQMYQHVWRNGGGVGNRDGLRFDIGWANVEPVSDTWVNIRNAVQGLSERYATWDVWGTPSACGGCNGGWDFNESCCGWENFNIDYALHRNRNKNRLCSDYITIGLDMTFNANDCGICFGDETNELEFRGWSSTNRPQLAITYTNTTAGTPSTFGANQWNVYAYACGNIDLSGSTYAGYYTETALGYNTTSKWCSSCAPSSATGWSGACVDVDNHIVVSKRQGFPCGIYQINIPSHDDDARVYINGTNVWQHLGGCCDAHTNIWTGYLDANSTIEYRHQEGGGGSNQEISFTNVTTSLVGGTIAGIANPTTICVGGDPGAFTSTVAASGGTIGITNGSPAAPVYQWERAPTNAFATITNVGTNATTYDPDASLAVGTYYFRRKVTDACGTVAYSNIIQINVVSDPTAPSLNVATPSSATTVCIGATVSATLNAGLGGTGSCTDEYQFTNDGGTTWSAYLPGTSITAVSAGSNRIQIQSRRVCDGLSCDGTGENWGTRAQWTVVADPVAPTITASPNTTSVCAGNTLTVAPSGGTGGITTCTNEYRMDIGDGSGFGAWSTTVPSTTSVTGQTVTIESRRNCDGLGCNSNINSVSWTVFPQPVVPTLNTATPASGSEACVGASVSATLSAGSGGVGCTDDFRFTANTGTSWAAYTSGNSITAVTGSIGTNGVQVQGRRASCTPASAGCTGTAYQTLATWDIFAQPINPTLNTKTPNVTNICAGQTVSATINSGSSGSTGATDEYRYSIDGGTAWATYTSGDNINTTSATGSVIIQGRRTGGGGTGCNTTSYTTITSWTVFPQIVAPTLNVATPSNGTNICLGQSVSATITAGSGGTGASDTYEKSIDGGTSWTSYTSGASIATGSATGSVQIRVSRSAGSGTGCNATGPTVIATWPVYPQVVAPTLNIKTPNVTDICAGQAVDATINAGSGGAPGAADSYEVSIDGGTSWAAYTSGSSIATGSATGSVQVRVSRSNGGGTGCTATGPTVVATWTVSPQIVAPSLNVKTPNATNVCAGTNVNATITAGSGGVGATDTYEYSIDGGAWTAYTSGNNISTTGATNVQIRVSRSAGTGTGCTATGPTVIATWNVDEYPAGTPNLSALYLCDLTAKLEVTGITPSGSTLAWTKSSGSGSPSSSSDNPLNVTGLTQGTTTVYDATLTNGTCSNISIGSVSIVVPTRNFTTISSVDECGYCVLTDGNVRTFFGPSGDLICRIEDVGNGTDLDETDACADVYGSVQTVYTAQQLYQPFLPRRLVITPSNNSNAIVRFYFTTAEYSALQSACSGTPFEFSSPSALRVTKFDGAYTDPPNHPATDASATLIFPTVSTTTGGYYAEFAVSSFSTFYIHSNMWPFAPLPVELKSFTGYHNGQVNVLDWITASEQNTNRFEIQKSLDAQSWESIGTVAAAGNSLVDMSYTFNDGNAINGTNYYRLKMIDNDESFTYSSIVKIDVNNAVIVNGIAQVFPNPTKGLLNVWVSSSKAEDVTFTVTDILGRSVQTVNKQLETGLNKLDFNFDKLASGTYIINYLDANSQRHYHKFIKD